MQSVNLHSIDALEWDEEDSITFSPNFPSVHGDTVAKIVRRRHISAKRTKEQSDTTKEESLSVTTYQTKPKILPTHREILSSISHFIWLILIVCLGVFVFCKRRL